MISADRLTQRPDGRVEYHFRRPDPTGRTSWVTDGSSWCRRLATLIPPRRSHTTRFHVVPELELETRHDPDAPAPMMLARHLDWSALLRRVFGDDVTQCPRCGDSLRVLAFITHPEVTARILDHLGLASAVPLVKVPRRSIRTSVRSAREGGTATADGVTLRRP